MFSFMRIGRDCYVLYKNGERITPYPLTKDEMIDKLADLKLSDDEERFIERFYGGGESFAEN